MHAYHGWPFLTDPRYPVLSAVGHDFLHGCISLFTVGPLVWRSRRRKLNAALAFLAGPALDLDHVVAADSLSPHKLEHLSGGRPVTHSLLFALLLALVVLALTRHATLAWSAFAIVTAHVLFDAAGGSDRWLYPLSRPDEVPWLLFPVTVILLTLVSAGVARGAPPARRAGHGPQFPPHPSE